jgi:hypothetical protein
MPSTKIIERDTEGKAFHLPNYHCRRYGKGFMSTEHCWNCINRGKIMISQQNSLTLTPCTKLPRRNSPVSNMACILRSRFLSAWDMTQEGPVISVCEHNDEGETWRSHSVAAEYSSLLRCFAVPICKELTTFWGIVAPLSWGLSRTESLQFCEATKLCVVLKRNHWLSEDPSPRR